MANNPGTQSAAKTAQTTEAAGEANLLDQVIGATRQTDREQAQMLLKALTEEALKGTVTYSRNMTLTFRKAIELIDKQLSQQVAAIMHHPDFLKLEGSWRGLNYLVMNSET
ncbi:MAG TPA: type VI secretion system contractile sheath large subunit, partial [Micropepsaceae bacterium]